MKFSHDNLLHHLRLVIEITHAAMAKEKNSQRGLQYNKALMLLQEAENELAEANSVLEQANYPWRESLDNIPAFLRRQAD